MFQGPDVKIYVGPTQRLFTVRKARICHCSAYFRGLFNGGFKEGSENVAYLKEDDVEAFDILLQWLDLMPLEIATSRHQPGEAWHVACKLFCLAEKDQVDGIQADIIALLDRFAILEGNKLQLETRTIDFVCKSVPDTTTPYQYVLAIVAKDLINAEGRDVEYYGDFVEGPKAIPGFAKGLIRNMKSKGGV